MSRALELLAALRIDDGRAWGSTVYPWQHADAEALISRDGPRRHMWLRPRGGSKTTDAGGCLLALLATEAPSRSRSYAFAADKDQAGLLLDAIAGFVARAGPALADHVELGASAITVKRTGARLEVAAADAGSSFGLRPWMLAVDEVAQWPNTTNHRRLWSSITSAMPKVADSRLLVTSTAGSPSHWSHQIFQNAQASDQWRVSTTLGPSPWWSATDLEAVRNDLTGAEWRRLILCEWAEGDEQMSTAADVAACVTHPGPLEPKAVCGTSPRWIWGCAMTELCSASLTSSTALPARRWWSISCSAGAGRCCAR